MQQAGRLGPARMFERTQRTWRRSRRTVPQYKSDASSTQSNFSPSIDPSILSTLQSTVDEKQNPYTQRTLLADLDWYLKWLHDQVANISNLEASLFIHSSDSTIPASYSGEIFGFQKIFLAVNRTARAHDDLSLDEIIEKLVEEDVLRRDETSDTSQAQRRLVFAILGWQSMLFQPSPSHADNSSTLDIYKEPFEPNSGLIFDAWSVSTNLSDRPLAILLKAFGNLLPARSHSSENVASELAKQIYSWTSLNSSDVNGYLLHTILQVRIRWVETLSLHLDYDKSTKTLSLFRYPSFCIAMLQSKGVIYSFASTEPDPIDPRATSEDITSFLQETLLSYRLLFGQTKASRRFFKNVLRSDKDLSYNPDPLLRLLCLDQKFAHPIVPPDRTVYVTARDFLVLGSRVERIANELQLVKPKSLVDLLYDRRDTLQYWTFWFVAIIGGASIFIGVLQVILATIQVLQASGKIN